MLLWSLRAPLTAPFLVSWFSAVPGS